MSYLNSVSLIGFVGSDPEQRQVRNNGAKFTVFSVATQRSWKNAEDEWVSKTEWHRIAVRWNLRSLQTAE
jgi:single-strand DNA-binding protein